MIITRTPLRISLVGGGTDMPDFFQKRAGAVVSFAIDKYVYVTKSVKFDHWFRASYSKLEIVDDPSKLEHAIIRETLKYHRIRRGTEIVTIADVPGSGTGLGSSSAVTVGLLKAIDPSYEKGHLAETAYIIEAEKCGNPVGKQDQYASAYGGFNYIMFAKNIVQVRPIQPSTPWMDEFEKHFLLLYTGITRDANEILRKQREGFSQGGNIPIGEQLSDLAHQFYGEIMNAGTPEALGKIMNKAWEVKKFMAQSISNRKVDDLYEKAMMAGAYGGKLLGAGGGGFLFFLAPPEKHEFIAKYTGLKQHHFKIDHEGSKVIYEYQTENAVRG